MADRTAIARWVLIALGCAAALLLGIALAYWQWTRYESGGTLQNLGYVLQWPLFGFFPAFLAWRIVRVARRERARQDGTPDQAAAPVATGPAAPARSKMAYVAPRAPAGSEDPVLADYNALLAELNGREAATSGGGPTREQYDRAEH